MAVKEGQVLARLDDSTSRAALALARSAGRGRAPAGRAENEVRLAQAKLTLSRLNAARSRTASSTQADVDGARADVDATEARIVAARAAGQRRPSGRSSCRRPTLDNTIDSRAVQRHRDLEGRAAGRDGLAGVGRRRLHAHRHLHDRRHALARDRRRRQRELHQSRHARPGRHARCSTRIRTGRFPAHVITIVPTADRQKATVQVRIAFKKLDPRILPDMGVKVTFLREADGQEPRPRRPRAADHARAEGRDQDRRRRQRRVRRRGDVVERRAVRRRRHRRRPRGGARRPAGGRSRRRHAADGVEGRRQRSLIK